MEVVLLARRDLRGGEDALRALLHVEEDVAVVVELASLHEDREVREHFRDLEARHELGEVRRVRADVAHAARAAGALRVRAPRRLHVLLARELEKPALRVLHHDLADLSEVARLHHVARELHHRVARVRVHEAERELRLLHERLELLRLGDGERHRLLAHHVESGLQTRLRDREVRVVRRADRDEVDALLLREGELARDHVLVRAVDALRIETEVAPLLEGLLGIHVERAGHDVRAAVHTRRLAVHLADERADAAANHTHLQFLHVTVFLSARIVPHRSPSAQAEMHTLAFALIRQPRPIVRRGRRGRRCARRRGSSGRTRRECGRGSARIPHESP